VFYRILGRFFFYFYVLPFIKDIFGPALRDAVGKIYEEWRTDRKEETPTVTPMAVLQEKLLSDRHDGLTDMQLAKKYGITVSQVRTVMSEARTASRADNIARAKSLSEAGESVAEIAKRMNLSQTSVMAMLRTDS